MINLDFVDKLELLLHRHLNKHGSYSNNIHELLTQVYKLGRKDGVSESMKIVEDIQNKVK